MDRHQRTTPWCCSPIDDLLILQATDPEKQPSPRGVVEEAISVAESELFPKGMAGMDEDINLESVQHSRKGTPVMEVLFPEEKDAGLDVSLPHSKKRKQSKRGHYKISVCDSWTSTKLEASSTVSQNASYIGHISSQAETHLVRA